jgi:PAS domain-containing protein
MDSKVASQFLTSDSDEIAELKANLNLVEGFIGIAREINALPDVNKRFYEESRSLFQITAVGRDIKSLESILSKFFGLPVKPAGKELPRKLRKNSTVKLLGGFQKDQSLFLLNLKTGQFYGALWPWRRNTSKIEVHLGYCSDWMTDDDYQQLENLVKHEVSHDAFVQIGADIGGQVRGISLPSFLQMAEMEKSSFSLRISSHRKIGDLHISDGKLISANCGDLSGCDAAYRVISWDDVSIDIEPLDESKRDEIKQPLMQVLMESLKIKDETTYAKEKPSAPPKIRAEAPKSVPPPKRLVQLERAPDPRKSRKKVNWMTIAVAAIGAAAIVAALYAAAIYMVNSKVRKENYELLIKQVDAMVDLDAKKDRLQVYLKGNPGSAHVESIRAKIKSLEKAIEERDFEAVTLKVSALPVNEEYEKKAVELFEQFLEKYPNSRLMPQINQAINEIKNLIDQYYYEELKFAARLDFNERLRIYRRYLERFPEGRYRNDVDTLINEMGRKFLEYLVSQESQCEQNKRWDACIENYDGFINTYRPHALAQKAMDAKNRLIAKRDYRKLQMARSDAGNDYLKVLSLYRDYASTHPLNPYQAEIGKEIQALNKKVKLQNKWIAIRNYATDPGKGLRERIQRLDKYLRTNRSSPYKSDAESLMAALDDERRRALRENKLKSQKQKQQAEAQRQREEMARRQARVERLSAQLNAQLSSSQRYQPNGDGTVLDRTTGLIWTLLDSEQELGGCLNYEAARKYVANLKYGGSNGWRLPTANELASILKRPPYFPSSGAQWYWSSEAYVKGFHAVADVVTAANESVFKREHRLQKECGAVRAVRSRR